MTCCLSRGVALHTIPVAYGFDAIRFGDRTGPSSEPMASPPRFWEEQIVGILKEHQAGLVSADLCRKHGIPDATFHTWRKTFGGMEVPDVKRLKALEEENAKLRNVWRLARGGTPRVGRSG